MDTQIPMETETRAYDMIQRANALHLQGRPIPAIALYREAAELYPPYASFHLVAGDLLAQLGQFQDAAEAYEALLQTHPDHDQARASLEDARRRLDPGRRAGMLGRLLGRR
jgi:tetratricopeptide (TPR) repeat protein